ncbi:MAG: HPr(Ser) kinase/phosphatase [Verrucomicrobia bacterium]|jgi:HPr kinase/phosphorylase|nr:MAG: HPr(Ser) kinase/phosphatase [Verrucomicrobiota bacterium]MDH4469638.1 HPr(Ser) kinase/phosphatase [Verrucomicrobiae bacterium]
MHKNIVKKLSVAEFFTRYQKELQLEQLNKELGEESYIKEPTVNRPGLALAGFFRYFPFKRLQVAGYAELSYLRHLPVEECEMRLREIFTLRIPALVISRGCTLSSQLLKLAEEFKVPVLRTPLITMEFINAATIALEEAFAPVTTEFGSMVDILGIGVLIKGQTGIGKSECVLGLIERGYSLVSDDITRFRNFEGRELFGTSSDVTRFHMEIRGIGIINIPAIFGIGAVRPEKRLDLIVTLKDWNEVEHIERVGLDLEFLTILGIDIPHLTIPVRNGRDVSRLVEVAALDQKLKSMGYHAALEFNNRLLQVMKG